MNKRTNQKDMISSDIHHRDKKDNISGFWGFKFRMALGSHSQCRINISHLISNCIFFSHSVHGFLRKKKSS